METRKKIASIEEYVISLRAEIYEETAEPEELTVPVEEPIEEQPVAEDVAAITEEPAMEDVAFEAEEPVEIVLPEPETAAEQKAPRAPAKSFDFKIVTADEITQDRYNELKNCAMQYKKLKSRVSKKFDSLNSGRTQFVKFGLAGRTLKVYLNLNLEDVEPKYHCKDQSFKKPYVQVPVLIRVRSGRAVKYAKKLTAQAAEFVALKPNPKYVPQDYITQMEELYKANLEKGVSYEDEAALSEDTEE